MPPQMPPGGRSHFACCLHSWSVLWGGSEPHGCTPAQLIVSASGLVPQVVKLDPEAYLKWVSMPSTGHPVMFASPLVEKMTCTEW